MGLAGLAPKIRWWQAGRLTQPPPLPTGSFPRNPVMIPHPFQEGTKAEETG